MRSWFRALPLLTQTVLNASTYNGTIFSIQVFGILVKRTQGGYKRIEMRTP